MLKYESEKPHQRFFKKKNLRTGRDTLWDGKSQWNPSIEESPAKEKILKGRIYHKVELDFISLFRYLKSHIGSKWNVVHSNLNHHFKKGWMVKLKKEYIDLIQSPTGLYCGGEGTFLVDDNGIFQFTPSIYKKNKKNKNPNLPGKEINIIIVKDNLHGPRTQTYNFTTGRLLPSGEVITEIQKVWYLLKKYVSEYTLDNYFKIAKTLSKEEKKLYGV